MSSCYIKVIPPISTHGMVPCHAVILYRESKSRYVARYCFQWGCVRTERINIIESASAYEPQNDLFIILRKVSGGG